MKKQYFKPHSRVFAVDTDSILAGSPTIDTGVTGGNTDVPTTEIEPGGGGDGTDMARGGFWDDSEW